MAIKVAWDNNTLKKIILFSFEGDWTWFDCRESLQEAQSIRDDLTSPVYYIYDFSQNRTPQRAYLANLQKLLGLELVNPPEKIIIVERGTYVQLLKDTLERTRRLSLENVAFADSLARARVIAEQD